MMSQSLSPTLSAPRSGFGTRFWPLFLLGLVGVASLPIVLVPLMRSRPLPPGAPDLPLWGIVLLSMLNPVLFLAAAAAVGAAVAHRVGLVSRLVERAGSGTSGMTGLRREVPLALGLGLLVSAVVAALDTVFVSSFGASWGDLPSGAPRAGSPAALLAGVLYGGITEEILLRWGLLSLLAWIGWRVVQGGKGAPHAVVMWSAVVIAALLFGAGHLPAVAAMVPLTPSLVVRTVALNALGGLVFGWLFWRRSLEAAMVAHMGAHLGFAILAALGLLG